MHSLFVQSQILTLVFTAFALFGLNACSSSAPKTTPCMSDSECRFDRICDEGRCRFHEDVARERAAAQKTREEALQRANIEASADASADAGPDPQIPVVDTQSEVRTSTWMGDPQRSGRSQSPPLDSPNRKALFKASARIAASPVLSSEQLIVAALDGSLTALDFNGTALWRFSVGHKIYSTPSFRPDGNLIFASDDGNITAISPQGQMRWKTALGDAIDSSPVIDPRTQTTFVGARGVHAISHDGKLLWHYPTAHHVRATPSIHPNGTVIIGLDSGVLVALDPDDGSAKWKSESGAPSVGSPAIDGVGHIYLGNNLGQVRAYDAQGASLWTFKASADIRTSPAVDIHGNVYAGCDDGKVYALDPNGKERWTFQSGGRIRSSIRLDREGNIYFGSQDDFFYSLTTSGDVRWKISIGQDVDTSAAFDEDGNLYIGADDGVLHRLSTK